MFPLAHGVTSLSRVAAGQKSSPLGPLATRVVTACPRVEHRCSPATPKRSSQAIGLLTSAQHSAFSTPRNVREPPALLSSCRPWRRDGSCVRAVPRLQAPRARVEARRGAGVGVRGVPQHPCRASGLRRRRAQAVAGAGQVLSPVQRPPRRTSPSRSSRAGRGARRGAPSPRSCATPPNERPAAPRRTRGGDAAYAWRPRQ